MQSSPQRATLYSWQLSSSRLRRQNNARAQCESSSRFNISVPSHHLRLQGRDRPSVHVCALRPLYVAGLPDTRSLSELDMTRTARPDSGSLNWYRASEAAAGALVVELTTSGGAKILRHG